jgi:membrane associated rhomboid family serine protease
MIQLKNLRTKFERFCYQNRNKGIPNLMLYVTLGSAIVYLLSMFDQSSTLYNALCFDRELILRGQVWRLFTYAFTFDGGHILITAIGLFCYYTLGRAMESLWGTLRFNLFYLTGIVLMDIFCLIFGGWADITYLNMSLFLAYATLFPDTRFLLLYFIPVKAWVFALFDLALTLYNVVMLTSIGLFPYSLFPLVAIANYFLFFGKDVCNVIPLSWRMKLRKLFRRKSTYTNQEKPPIQFYRTAPDNKDRGKAKPSYTHRCTVCGRTDVSHPELEFRYCSRCTGYHCYCEEHISNHTHIQ